MRRKTGILFFLVIMMAWEVAASEDDKCWSFIECYNKGVRNPNYYNVDEFFTQAIERWDPEKDSQQLLADTYYRRGK